MTPQFETPAPDLGPTADELFRYHLFRLTPKTFVTWALIALNVLVFIGMALSGLSIMDPSQEGLIKWGADYGPLVTHGEWWRMFTATFIHIGIVHIAMNMWVLYGIGPFVERLFGNISFFVLYVLSGLGGSLLSLLWKPDILSAGASGAVFGLYGGLLGFLLRERRTVPKERLMSLLQNAGIFLVFNLGYGLKDSRVDMGAHLGGFLTGFVVALALARPLSPINMSKRLQTAALVAVGGLALIAVGTTRIQAVDDLILEIAHFDPLENKVIELFDAAVHKVEGQVITPQAFGDFVEQKVLPPYQDEAAKISHLKTSDRQLQLKNQLQQYLKLRVEGYSEIARGVGRGDQMMTDSGKAKIAKANAFSAAGPQ